jgi:hypothetical protein
VDAAIVNTTTSQASGGAANEDLLDRVFEIEKQIVLQLFDSLGVTLTTAERNAIEQRPTRSMQAFLAYSHGLELEDQGRFGDAAARYREAARIDPSFLQASQRASNAEATAVGTTLTATSIETSLQGTTEGSVAEKAAEGQVPSNEGTENSAQNLVDQINESPSKSATETASTSKPGTKDGVSESLGVDVTKKAVVRVGVPLPRIRQ